MIQTKYAIAFIASAFIMCALLITGKIQPPFGEQIAAVFYSTPGVFVQNTASSTCVNQLPKTLLSWSSSTNASYYQIQRKTDSNLSWTSVLDVVSKVSPSYVDVRWQPDYGAINTIYRIIAVNGNKKTYSNEIIIKTPECRAKNLALLSPTIQTNPTATTSVTTATTTFIINTKMPTGLKWGAYVGWQDNAMSDFENLVGKRPDMEMVFAHWGNDIDFPSYYSTRIKDKGRTMVLFWEALDYRNDYTKQPEYSFDAVLSGKLDGYFKHFAAGAKLYQGPVIIALYSEFNGNWFPWGGVVGTNTPQKYIDSYRYVRNFFTDVPNVKFAWVPNSDSVPNTAANQPELFYPGDAYVDYVGVDGFDFGGADEMSFDKIFSTTLGKLQKYNKPVYIFSMGVADSATKADWINNAFTVELYKHPEVKGWLWFNENKEKDWRVNSTQDSLTAFKAVLP